jgi:HME family heavy-metal exporter
VAVTIFGGLISATILDALLTPVLFLRYGEKPLRRLMALRNEDVSRLRPEAAQTHHAY